MNHFVVIVGKQDEGEPIGEHLVEDMISGRGTICKTGLHRCSLFFFVVFKVIEAIDEKEAGRPVK